MARKRAWSRGQLNIHLKSILGALLSRIWNIIIAHLVLGLKKNLKQAQCSNGPPGLRLTSQTSQKYKIL